MNKNTEKDSKKDPVCGMDVNVSKSSFQAEQDGRTYYFCSEDCKQKFAQNPKDYSGKSKAA